MPPGRDAGLLAGSKRWARALRTEVMALYLAARDPRVPLHVKCVAAAVAAYALSPIDLIPDVIPVLGYLDDLILVPLGIMLAVRLIPPPLMREFRATARRQSERPTSRAAAWAIVAVWFLSAVSLLWLFWRPQGY